MTNKLPFLLLLPIATLLLSAAIAAPAADVCPAGDCLLPDVAYQICTPTPEPVNPRRYVAGSNGMAETNSIGHYNWNPYIGSRLPVTDPEHEHIPMYRDLDDVTRVITGQLTATNLTVVVGGNSDWLLTFNEPDLAPDAGSDMTVDEVVVGLALVEALHPDKLIVSPAYSPYAYTRLETVRDRFIQVYGRPPRWDAIAMHCYFVDSAASCVTTLDWYVAKAAEWDAELWVTEFAALATTGSAGPNWAPAVASGSAFIDVMEDRGVDRYFWFSHCQEAMPYYACELANDDGTLTPLGEMYRSK